MTESDDIVNFECMGQMIISPIQMVYSVLKTDRSYISIHDLMGEKETLQV